MKKVLIVAYVVTFGLALGLSGCKDRAQQAELDRLQAEVRSLNTAMEKARAEQNDRQAGIDTLIQTRDRLEGQVKELSGARDGLQQQLAEVQTQKKELQSQLDATQGERDAALQRADKLTASQKLLQQELDTITKSRDAAVAEEHKAQEEAAKVTTQLQAATQKVRELQEQVAAAPAIAESSGKQAIQNPAVYSLATTRPRVNAGQSSTLSWQVSNADRIRIEPDIGVVGALGSRTVTPLKTTTYTLIATNKIGESRVTLRIEVF